MSEEDDEFYELICFMATSARGLVDEPKYYSIGRMIDSLQRLLEILEKKDIERYQEIRENIESKNFYEMDEERLKEDLDEIIKMLLDEAD